MANSNVLSQKSGKSGCQTRVRQTIVYISSEVCSIAVDISRGCLTRRLPSHRLENFLSKWEFIYNDLKNSSVESE